MKPFVAVPAFTLGTLIALVVLVVDIVFMANHSVDLGAMIGGLAVARLT